jgi:hypothetical protein
MEIGRALRELNEAQLLAIVSTASSRKYIFFIF